MVLLLEVQVVFNNCYLSAILKFCTVIVLILNAKNQFFKFKKKANFFLTQDPVVRRPISANPGLNFNPGLFFFS